jgi:hypothetical protein
MRAIIMAFVALALTTAAAPPEFLREQRTVTIAGKPEVWQLVWQGRPKPVCGVEDVEMAITCPCTGFAYGEMGKLALVRKRDGKVIDRMQLGPLFDELPADNSNGLAAMQWRPMKSSDFDRASDGASPAFRAEVAKRPGQRVMRLSDYDHDGVASEFLVQVSAGPCGHTSYVAVGVSKARPQLHALGSAAHPDGVLQMSGAAWQALIGGNGPRRVTHWQCGDHGAETREELELEPKGGVIKVTVRSYSCPEDGSREKLLETSAF